MRTGTRPAAIVKAINDIFYWWVRWVVLGRRSHKGRGRVEALKGRYRAYGQELDVGPGAMIFAGPIDAPGLDISAWRRHQQVEAGIHALEVVEAAARAAGTKLDRAAALHAYHEIEPVVQAERYRSYREVLTLTAQRIAERLSWRLAPGRAAFLAAIADGMPGGYGTGDGAALHFVGTELERVVTSRPSARAFHVAPSGADVTETELATHFLGAPVALAA